jgi:hypothetical protein
LKKGGSLSKNKIEKPQREVTKRQLSHWQRESRLQKSVIIAGIVIIAAILIIVGTGVYLDKYKPYHTTVLKVGETEYSMDYFIDSLVLSVNSSPYRQYMSADQLLQYMVSSVPQQIEQDQILMEEAAKLNVIVSDNETQQYITDNKLTSNKATFDLMRYQLLIQKLQTDYFDKQIQPETQRNLQAMFLESQSQVDAVKNRLNNGENFSDLAGELSTETTSKANKGDFGWIPQGVLSTILGTPTDTILDNSVFDQATSVGALSQVGDDNQTKDIGYWILKVTETDPSTNQVHLLAMLLGNKVSADNMISKLNSGADFITEAKTNSLYDNASADGGDLGFISKGVKGDAIDAVIFPEDPSKSLPLNTLSAPIPDTTQKTPGGIWLFRVNNIEPNKEVTGNNRTILVNQKLETWAAQVWKDNQSRIQNLLNPDLQAFAISKAQSRLQ